jgi:hypothetical protein
MRKWATSKVDEDHELEEEAQLIADLDDEIDVESDEEDEPHEGLLSKFYEIKFQHKGVAHAASD